MIGFLTVLSGILPTVQLITFFLVGSRVTRIGADRKAMVDGEYEPGGHRGAGQVMSTAALPTVLAVIYAWLHDWPLLVDVADPLVVAYTAVYATCLGDTMASELGILSTSLPRLITTFQQVPAGVNGAVSGIGTLACLLGGFLLGLVGLIVTGDILMLTLSLCSSIVGMLLDSFLGAVFQPSYVKRNHNQTKVYHHPVTGGIWLTGWNVLSNQQVNLVSCAMTAILFGLVWPTQ
jgi:uncharacterized protein (TIGR00297 family)